MNKGIALSKRVWFGASAAALMALAVAPTAMAATPQRERSEFNEPGNVLISDQFNNRVIEVDPKTHRVVWTFGDGSSVAGPHSIVGVNDAERVGTMTLLAGTGTPANTDPSCTDANGCADNRVMLVNKAGQIVWQYGMAGVTGSGANQLNTPVQATYLPDGHVLISDQGNQRVIEVNQKKEIVWQYGMTGISGADINQLNSPNSAELLRNGHILIADENNNRVIEVTRDHKIVWQYPKVIDTALLNAAAFASRLCNGDTLITDANNNRIDEVTMAGKVVWQYVTNTRQGSIDNPIPTRAVRLRNGNTLISDQFNDQVIEVNKAGKIVYAQGAIQVDGNGFNQLNAPYDAKVIGDYTGLTPPTRLHGMDGEMHSCSDK